MLLEGAIARPGISLRPMASIALVLAFVPLKMLP